MEPTKSTLNTIKNNFIVHSLSKQCIKVKDFVLTNKLIVGICLTGASLLGISVVIKSYQKQEQEQAMSRHIKTLGDVRQQMNHQAAYEALIQMPPKLFFKYFYEVFLINNRHVNPEDKVLIYATGFFKGESINKELYSEASNEWEALNVVKQLRSENLSNKEFEKEFRGSFFFKATYRAFSKRDSTRRTVPQKSYSAEYLSEFMDEDKNIIINGHKYGKGDKELKIEFFWRSTTDDLYAESKK